MIDTSEYIFTLGPELREWVLFDTKNDCQLSHWFLAPSIPTAAKFAKAFLAGKFNDDPRYTLLSGHNSVLEEYKDSYEEPLTEFLLCDTDRKVATRFELVNGQWKRRETSKELYES